MSNRLRISLVIPVYNEESHLEACLQAALQQTESFYEIIVVDNNSTDDTPLFAARFPGIKLITENRQGVVHARTTGFDIASGDIIARIDADTVLPADWTQAVQEVFQDSVTDAVSGVALYYNVALGPVFNAIDLFFRRRLSWQLKDRVFLYGANMALRRQAWEDVRQHLCNTGGMHEDYDIAIHLQEIGGVVRFDERLRARVSSRRIDVNYFSFLRYAWVAPNTYAQHNIRNRWHMYPLVSLCAVAYLPARMLHRGYNADTDSFSFSKIFARSQFIPRVDPTAHVAD